MRRVLLILCLCIVGALVAGTSAASAAPPANDDFANAEAISGPLPLEVTGSTVEATRQAGEPVAAEATPSGHSIWFRWVAPATEYVSVGTCGSEPRTLLAVYTGASLGNLTEVASNFYLGTVFCRGLGGEGTGVGFTAHAGTAYSIAIDGDGRVSPYLTPQSGEGPVSLVIAHPAPPPNDDFEAATPLEAGASYTNTTTLGATHQPGEPYPRGVPGGASTWFEWTAPRSGYASFNACGAPLYVTPEAAVYTGSSVHSLTPVPEFEPGSPCGYEFVATAGTTYRIVLDGRYSPAADAPDVFDDEVGIRYAQGNDNFADASPLGRDTTGVWVGFQNVRASKEPGEPDHAGNAGGASVWFTYEVGHAGYLEVSACEATFPALVAVYVGSSLGTLTPLGSAGPTGESHCIDESSAPGDVRFEAPAHTLVHIAVDGFDGARGHFSLKLKGGEGALPKVDLPGPTAAPTPIPPGPAIPTAKIAARRIDQVGHSATFALRSTQPGTHFRCRLDQHRFAGCGTKVTYRHLASGRHVFRALAIGPGGAVGAPVTARFRIRGSG